MRSILVLLFTFVFIVSDLSAQKKEDKKKSATELGALNGGVVYSLPRTGIRVFVEVSQEKFFHGPYAEFAAKYLGIKNAPTSDNELWKITKLKMETFGEPDPTEMHKARGAVASMLSLSDNGVLLGINSSVKSDPDKEYTSDFTSTIEIPREVWPDLSMQPFTIGKDTTHQTNNKLKPFEEKAAEAAHDVIKLRKRKAYVLAANYDKLPPDGQSYQVMVDELSKTIGNYEGLFIGKSFKTTHHYTFEIVPEVKGNKAIVAFRFSPTAGVLPESNVSAKPIMLELDPNTDLARNGEAKAAPAPGETSTNGLFYRTPGMVVARLLNGSDVLAQARFSMAQYGVSTPIPDGLVNGEYSIEIHPVTGAIQRIGN